MQLSRKMLIKIDGNQIKCVQINGKGQGKKCEAIKYNDFKKLDTEKLFSKNVYILIENEEIYTKLVTVPKVSKRYLYTIIENEILYYFNSSDLVYNYSVISSDINSIKIIVACLNITSLNILKKQLFRSNIKSLCLVQNCFMNYYRKHIKDYSYILIFCYNKSLYFLGCIDNIIILNRIIKNIDSNSINKDTIKEFLINCRDIYKEYKFDSIYYSNISDHKFLTNDDLNTRFIDLGMLSGEIIINYFIYGRQKHESI